MSWLDRQSFLGSESDKVLNALTVGLVGLGGGGSHVAQQLAHVGVGNFVVLDNDIISETNLNRLVGGTRKDVDSGLSKVAIAERVIQSVNPAATVEKHSVVWQQASEALKRCDVVIGGLDNVRSKYELDAFTRRFMIPYIDMGMDVHRLGENDYLIAGQVVLTGPGEPCLQCLGIVTEAALTAEARKYGDAGGNPQVVWPNGLLASIAVGLLVQLVSPWKKECMTSAFIEYDGNLNITREAARWRRCRERQCPHYQIADVGDPTFDFRKVNQTAVAPEKGSDPQPDSWWMRFLKRIKNL
ncbi:MAG TPA: ThiF family adenylyltransferase [Chthoniobacterales bacterium]|jgi:hypothetical protein